MIFHALFSLDPTTEIYVELPFVDSYSILLSLMKFFATILTFDIIYLSILRILSYIKCASYCEQVVDSNFKNLYFSNFM
jgi:hypothetical protein